MLTVNGESCPILVLFSFDSQLLGREYSGLLYIIVIRYNCVHLYWRRVLNLHLVHISARYLQALFVSFRCDTIMAELTQIYEIL